MDVQFKDYFADRWSKYFPGSELPLTFYYSDKVARHDRRESEGVALFCL